MLSENKKNHFVILLRCYVYFLAQYKIHSNRHNERRIFLNQHTNHCSCGCCSSAVTQMVSILNLVLIWKSNDLTQIRKFFTCKASDRFFRYCVTYGDAHRQNTGMRQYTNHFHRFSMNGFYLSCPLNVAIVYHVFA